MRVQFSVDLTNCQNFQHLASANGYPDVPTYYKRYFLRRKGLMRIFWDKVKGIGKMPSGHVFALSGLNTIPTSKFGSKYMKIRLP